MDLQPIAVVLDFVQPTISLRRPLGRGRKHGSMKEAGANAGTGPCWDYANATTWREYRRRLQFCGGFSLRPKNCRFAVVGWPRKSVASLPSQVPCRAQGGPPFQHARGFPLFWGPPPEVWAHHWDSLRRARGAELAERNASSRASSRYFWAFKRVTRYLSGSDLISRSNLASAESSA